MSQNFTPDQWEEYFQQHEVPSGTKLDSGSRITDPKTFIATQITLLRHHGEAFQGKICRDRLIFIKETIEAAKNK
jgi:hypothetical protein